MFEKYIDSAWSLQSTPYGSVNGQNSRYFFGHVASNILKWEALVPRMDFLNFSSLGMEWY